MVYYYFPSKNALFMAVVEEVCAKLLDDLGAVLAATGPSFEAKLEGLYGRLAKLSDEEAQVLGLVMREALGSSTRVAALFERLGRGHIPLLVKVFGEAQAVGQVRQTVPALVLVLVALTAGLVPQMIRRRLIAARVPVSELLPGPTQLAYLLSDLVLNGLSKSVENSR